ncbi:MAG: hypothetical protein IT371_17695 [Deltaproteobacteria bacterium]|nr:hypothetical protein [Deltaproteobacteria bacterium]
MRRHVQPRPLLPHRHRPTTRWRATHAALLTLLLAACGRPEVDGFLSKPIPLRLARGMAFALIRYGEGPPLTALLDSAAPVSALAAGGGAAAPHRRDALRLLDAEHPEVTRFMVADQDTYEVPMHGVGLDHAQPIQAVVGAPLLSLFSVRLSHAGRPPSVTIRDEIPDSTEELAGDCDPWQMVRPTGAGSTSPCPAIFLTRRLGGGILSLGGVEQRTPASRLAVPVCMLAAPFDPRSDKPERIGPGGVPATAVLSTGLGVSVIARSTFERLRAADPTIPEQVGHTLNLPSGPESVSLTRISRLSLVSDESRDLGPCAEQARRRRLLVANRATAIPSDLDQYGASVAELLAPVELAVLRDDAPLLQGLRQELRTTVPDVDLVLGASVLANFDVDLDYPSERTILRCAATAAGSPCRVLPHCSGRGDRPACLQD